MALFFTIATIMVISILVYGMIFFMRGEVHLSENYVDSTCALLLAEAGVEESLFTIKTQMNDPKNPIYDLITKKDEGTIDIDLGHLEGKTQGISPLIQNGKVKARVSWKHDPAATKALVDKGLPANAAREGILTIDSRGAFNQTKKQVQVKKTLKAVLMQATFPGNSLGMIAPDHGLYFNEAKRDSFKIVPNDFFDPWGFRVDGGKVFMKEGAKIDLSKWLIMTKLYGEMEHPWLDRGIGGFPSWFNGGTDLSGAKSIEFSNEQVSRVYEKWLGWANFPRLWGRSDGELYNSSTKKVDDYEPKKINLYPGEIYRKLANRLVDPKTNPSHGKYFTDVNFTEAFGRNQVDYKNVIPLYGWGDWRKVPNKFNRYLGNPNRAHDTSHAVEINGLTFIKGDVFLEGWVKGKGLLVVQGNIYVGGDVMTLNEDSGGQSAVGIIALRDPEFDHSKENPLTGRVIYKPHHDSDWSRMGITHPFRNMSPTIESCVFAQGGMELDTDSSIKKLINMKIVGNLVTDYFNRLKMPNDITIKHYNWQEVLAKSSYDYVIDRETKYSQKYELSVMKEILSWREVEVTI